MVVVLVVTLLAVRLRLRAGCAIIITMGSCFGRQLVTELRAVAYDLQKGNLNTSAICEWLYM